MKHCLWPVGLTAAACALALLVTGGGHAGEKKDGKKKDAKAAGKPIEIKGELTDDDTPDKDLGGPSKLHKVKLKKGTAYTIDLMSRDFDAFLRLLSPGGDQIAQDDDSGGGLNSRIRFTPAQDGEYQLVATSLNRKTGKYVLRVGSPAPLAAGKKLKAGDTEMDRFAQTDPDVPGVNKRGKVYAVDMKADKTYVIDLMSGDFDAFLILQDKAGKTLAVDDDGGEGLNSRLRFRCPADGTYTIIATGLGSPVGEFTLQLREE